MTSALHHD